MGTLLASAFRSTACVPESVAFAACACACCREISILRHLNGGPSVVPFRGGVLAPGNGTWAYWLVFEDVGGVDLEIVRENPIGRKTAQSYMRQALQVPSFVEIWRCSFPWQGRSSTQ